MINFKKIKVRVGSDCLDYYLLYIFNAYILYMLINALLLPIEPLFLVLTNEMGVLSLLVTVGLGFLAQRIISKQVDSSWFNKLLVVLFSTYFTVVSYKSPSLLITLAFTILSLAIYFRLMFAEEKWRCLIPGAFLITLPKAMYRLYHPYLGDLGRFKLDLEAWDFNQLGIILLGAIYALLAVFVLNKLLVSWRQAQHWSLSLKMLYGFVGLLGLAYVLYLSIITAYKVKTLSVSTFDVGIFAQMFESMRRDLTQITTMERDKLLSHFAVHISPIFT